MDVLVLEDNVCKSKDFLLRTAEGLRLRLDEARLELRVVGRQGARLQVRRRACAILLHSGSVMGHVSFQYHLRGHQTTHGHLSPLQQGLTPRLPLAPCPTVWLRRWSRMSTPSSSAWATRRRHMYMASGWSHSS